MKKGIIIYRVLIVFLLGAILGCSEGYLRGGERSYLKYPPSKSLPPASIWNPILNERNGKIKSKSYFKYPDSKILPQGSIWNPLIETPIKKGKRK